MAKSSKATIQRQLAAIYREAVEQYVQTIDLDTGHPKTHSEASPVVKTRREVKPKA